MVKTTRTVNNWQKKQKQTNNNLHVQNTFLYISLPLFCTAMEVGEPMQVGAVTRSGEVKNNPPLHAVLQSRHPSISRLLNVH